MSPIYCSQGHDNSADHRFCRLCGEPLSKAPSRLPSPDAYPPSMPDPNSGKIVGQRYRLQHQLGSGGFGQTYLAEDINRFNERCVLKEFAPQVEDPDSLKKAEQLFEREAGVLYQLQHAQIPRFRELLRVDFDGRSRLFLVQDYVEGQNFQTLLDQRQQQGRTFTETEIVQLFRDVLPVLAYIHSLGVIHRDISPDNLMRRDSDRLPVLIDFGGVKQAAISILSGLGESRASVTIVGKHGYAPYEQMASGQALPHSDFYALAATTLVLMTGQSPDYLLDVNSPGYWETQLSLSPVLTTVLRKMLAPHPTDRYTSAQAILTTLFPPVAPASPIAPPQPSPAPARGTSVAQTVAVAPAHPGQPSSGAVPASTPIHPSPGQRPMRPASASATATVSAASTASSSNLKSCATVLALVIGLGGVSAWVGYSVIPNWLTRRAQQAEQVNPSDEGSGGELESSSLFSAEEQQRKEELRAQRDRLGISERFLVQLTDASFYVQYPQQRGRALTAQSEDEEWRQKWDAIAAQWLDQLETLLTPEALAKLGHYGQGDRSQWRTRVNRLNVSSRALNDLTDAQFFATFPDQRGQQFLNTPIGQIWHAMASEQLGALEAGNTLETIQFAAGSFSATVDRSLSPGTGHVYLVDVQQGQAMRLNLNASNSAQLSLYVPRPTNELPFLLEDSADHTWSGQLPQTGVYEIVVVLDAQDRGTSNPESIRLKVAVDNVSTSKPNRNRPEQSDPPAADPNPSADPDPAPDAENQNNVENENQDSGENEDR